MITVIITIGDIPSAHRAPVLDAVRMNLGIDAVREVHVLSEGTTDWLSRELGVMAARLHVHPIAERPKFHDLFSVANRLLAEGHDCITIMNADISFAASQDIDRITEIFGDLSDEEKPVILALTRHERTDQGAHINLFDDAGVANCMSADAWVFRAPVHVSTELFYSPGQMNCDMFLTHDLTSSGFRLFNPCLDVKILHHELAKDNIYYDQKNKERDVQDLLQKHIKINKIDPFDALGTLWVKTDWLKLGYRPQPLSTQKAAVILISDDVERVPEAETLRELAALCRKEHRALKIYHCGDPELFFERFEDILTSCPEIYLIQVRLTAEGLTNRLLQGREYTHDTIAFVHDHKVITPQFLAEADCICVGFGDSRRVPMPASACTLITSVFRAEDYLAGFIANCLSLTGYGRLIDHIFLVSALSETESRLLARLLSNQPAVTVFWNRHDPGLYNCWNLGIRLAQYEYISNANVDDLRAPDHVVSLIENLEHHPDVVVAASALNPFYDFPHDGRLPPVTETWYTDRAGRFGVRDLGRLDPGPPVSLSPHNMPHCMPVWRRSLHDRCGWFDEEHYGTYADWAFWLNALRGGYEGWLNPAPLGFYFVNPTSHNRRGTDLDTLHRKIEHEFLPLFLDRSETGDARPEQASETWSRSLKLSGRDTVFGVHRNSFNRLVHALSPLERRDNDGVWFLPFLERYFVWGDEPGEARSGTPAPLTQDWIGILHVPFDAPDWFSASLSPENWMKSRQWRESLPYCRGIITLSADLEADLNAFAPEIPTLSVRHPIEMDAKMFSFEAYEAHPRVLQVGDWLRKLQGIHRLRAFGHERVMLLKQRTAAYLENEMAIFGDMRDPAVVMRDMVPNDEYDDMLSSSVVVCLLYATAANNIVLECLARATPLLINPLPSVVEYLGSEYPLYVRDEAEADMLLSQPEKIQAAQAYLLRRRVDIDLSYSAFCRTIADSDFYAKLPQKVSAPTAAPDALQRPLAQAKVLVLANCTHYTLGLALRQSGVFGQIDTAELYSMSAANREALANRLNDYDYVLTLEHGENFGPLATAALRDVYGNKIYSLPTPFFSGTMPDMAYIRQGNDIARAASVLGDYHSALILEELRSGFSEDEVVARYVSGEAFARLDIQGVWDDNIAELRKREEHTDIALSPFIEAEAKAGQIAGDFLSFNHPTERMINHIAQSFIEMITGERPEGPLLTKAQHNLYADAFWPMHPAVAAALKISPAQEVRFKQPQRLGGQWMSLTDFARQSVRFFAEGGDLDAFATMTPAFLPGRIQPAERDTTPPGVTDRTTTVASHPGKQIILTHFGRSGSTVLSQLLSQHSRIRWLQEFFSLKWIQSPDTYDFGLQTMQDMVDEAIVQMRRNRTDIYVGHEIKLMNFQQNPSCDMPTYLAATADPDIYTHIILRRKNILKRIVSNHKAAQTKVYHIRDNSTEYHQKTFALDFNNLVDFDTRARGDTLADLIANVARHEEETLAEFARLGIPTFEINYEDDIEADPVRAYEKIIAHLGLDPEPVKASFQKTSRGMKREIENYDRIAQALEGTPYAWMLD